ncbi:MAG: SDR family NAD(P)-dependent oxidoreductase [Verrucomicrobia bacterium]|nr:SDR family NAD(P)-dependent oxidoreductase [Cytophagales bacterium]
MNVLITGATSGIGEATARLLATQNYHLILCGRRQEKLDELKQTLDSQVLIHTLCFDVQDKNAVAQALESLPENFRQIDILINNAGNAHGLSPIQEGDMEDWEMMIDTNVKGLLYLTRLISPQMVARKTGHIINLGSIAGKEVYPNGNVYNASKFAVDALTKAMLMDLNPYGIKVTSVNPGAVETEFSLIRFKGDETKAKKVYEGFQPLHPEDVANTIWFVINQPPHVNISDVTVLPLAQASAMVLNRKKD